jgi:hypothetical protein
LLEIDLLRSGLHTVAATRERLARHGPYDFLVSLSRGDRRALCDAWGVSVRQRLPRVAVPLLSGDPDVVLDLQALFTDCYDRGGYSRRVDYRRDPVPPLTPGDAAWSDALLRQRSLRT